MVKKTPIDELPFWLPLKPKKHPRYYNDTLYRNQYKLLYMILDTNIGNHVNDVYSIWCKKCNIIQKHLFYKQFGFEHSRMWNYYYVDDNGCVRESKWDKGYNDSKTFYSLDYRREIVFNQTFMVKGRTYKEGQSVNDYYHNESYYGENKFTIKVVSGFSIRFESVRDPAFIKLKAEKQKLLKKQRRTAIKERKAKYDSFVFPKKEEEPSIFLGR